MSASFTVAPAGSTRLGSVFARTAIGCLLALPPVMAVAHRSSPLLLTLAALFALAATVAEGRLAGLGDHVATRISASLGVTVLAFMLWAAASATWSPTPLLSLYAWGEFALPLAAGLVAAAILPRRMGAGAGLALAVSMGAAALIVILDLATGMTVRHALGMRAAPFVLNRPVLTLLVLLPVALLLLWRERRAVPAILLTVLVGAAILTSESGAAKLGLAALAAMGGITLLSRRIGLVLTGAGLLLAIAMAPVAGELASRTLPDALYHRLATAHAQERVDIWRSFGAILRQRPILGFGFGSSPHLDATPASARLAPDQHFLLAVGHPHSAGLQIWVELGAIGAGFAALIAMLIVRAMQRLDGPECAAMTALVAAALADSLVGQGAWQGWWPAGIAAALIWLGRDRARMSRISHEPA